VKLHQLTSNQVKFGSLRFETALWLDRRSNMTSYIPSITIPGFIFDRPAAAILLPLALGNVVGYATRPDATKKQYMELKQPPLNPPAYIFAPVWTALYGAMGYASHRAWTAGMQSFNAQRVLDAKHGATLYTIQLGLNLLWMPLFFGFQRPIEASVDIVALVGVTVYLTYLWSRIDPVAAWVMVPYLGWLGFATYLCTGCGYLNGWDFRKKAKQPKEE